MSEIGCENLARYYEGGFCPIELGDRIAGRFTVLHKLGFGGYATVWLVRDDEQRHGQYVALKVVSAETSDRDNKSTAVADRLRRFERDNGFPGLFILELEHVFHTSRNGRHLCQVLPVLGPSLASLNTEHRLLYPSFARDFARQLARILDTMHALGVCHGDLTLGNVAVALDKPLDSLTERQLSGIFGKPKTHPLDFFFPSTPSPAPKYAVEPVDLALLPSAHLSGRLCLIDLDYGFLVENSPKKLPIIPSQYLASESIFTLTNGPAADVWALGCILYLMRTSKHLFDNMGGGPAYTVARMGIILGDLPREWHIFPFHEGYPVHGSRQPDVEYRTFPRLSRRGIALEKLIDMIREPRTSRSPQTPKRGSVKSVMPAFFLAVPEFWDPESEDKFTAKNQKPISKQDAAVFSDLLRKIFDYDPRKRLTARQVLEHPWLQAAGQGSHISRSSPSSGVPNSPRRANPTTTRNDVDKIEEAKQGPKEWKSETKKSANDIDRERKREGQVKEKEEQELENIEDRKKGGKGRKPKRKRMAKTEIDSRGI